MKHFALAALLLLGCSSPVDPSPTTSEEWAVRCTRIIEDKLPDKRARFAECVQDWEDWLKAKKAAESGA